MPVAVVFRPPMGMINRIHTVRLVVVIRQKKLDGLRLDESENFRAARAASTGFPREIYTIVVAQASVAN